jgi:hypothetical protein
MTRTKRTTVYRAERDERRVRRALKRWSVDR